ncbi:MAG TPA: VOC family protein [Solirubrobacteraceae bacterium]|nr:VOC family protein [Solirubrobacteraceae bacterium]
MFDHVTIRASDREASERFYATVLAPLGVARTYSGDDFAEWDDFSLAAASADAPVTRRLHIAWLAPSRKHVDEFWRVGTSAGYRDDGPPGERPQYSPDYYGAFLLDPDGNSAEAVHHGEPQPSGHLDHLWIRVADVAAAKRFYETIGPFAGFEIRDDTPDRVQFAGSGASFSVVAGEARTEHVHLAFPARSNDTVDAFHGTAVDAGYRDNGAPGERPVYHSGYYGAFVLDPDGNNVEVVNHNRA